MKRIHHHIVPWTTWVVIAFILGVLVHVTIFAPLKDREFMQYIRKSHDYLGITERIQRTPNIQVDDVDESQISEAVDKTLEQSIIERSQGVDRDLYVYQKEQRDISFDTSPDEVASAPDILPEPRQEIYAYVAPPEPDMPVLELRNVEPLGDEVVRNFTEEPTASKEIGFAPDIDVGNKPVYKQNPVVIPKRVPLSWSNDCNVYAAVAKHCYITGYDGGKPTDAVVDVNNIIGFYTDGQYKTCIWAAEYGIKDKSNEYLPLDTDTLMMLIDKRCNDGK